MSVRTWKGKVKAVTEADETKIKESGMINECIQARDDKI